MAIISYDLWQRHFAGARDVIHRQIRLDSEQYAIVGVMPPHFAYPYRSVKAWVPLQRYLTAEDLESHDNHMLTLVARLRPGVSVAHARGEIDGIAALNNSIPRNGPARVVTSYRFTTTACVRCARRSWCCLERWAAC